MRALSYYILLYHVHCCLLEAYSFLKRGGAGVDLGDREELGGEERGNCGLVVPNREESIFNKKNNDSELYVQIGHQSARDAHVNQVFKETSKWQNSRNRYTYCICEPHKFSMLVLISYFSLLVLQYS